MTGYNSRRTPNMSQPIASLSNIPPAHVSTQQDESYSTGNDMAMFANAEFNDSDPGAGIAELPLFFETNPADPAYHPLPPHVASTASPSNRPQPPSTSSSTSAPDHPPLTNATASTRTSTSPPAVYLNAEEDKRRRNTAASARFRVKKKEREQALARNTEELRAKVDRLEQRVSELEIERKWLRGLV